MAKAQKVTKALGSALVEVPILPTDGSGHRTLTLALSERQGRILKAVFAALRRDHATMKNDRHVDSAANSIQWILDKIGDSADFDNF